MERHGIKLHGILLLLLLLMSFLWTTGFVAEDEEIEVSSQPDIEQGREIYQVHCLECHGTQGQGDGPSATKLADRLGSFSSDTLSSKTDDELMTVINAGVPQTAMKGWEARLSIDDRRNVLAYIRSLNFQ